MKTTGPIPETSIPGTRSGARAPDALRPITIERNILKYAEGSALISVGDTRVLCSATVEEKVPQWLRSNHSGQGWVTAEYAMLPRATAERISRERARGPRSQEIQRLVGRSLRAVMDLQALGERTILMDCDVLQADGGTRTASITGALVALADALAVLASQGKLTVWPLKQLMAAVSVGLVEGRFLLDLDYREDQAASLDCNLVMTDDEKLIEIQGTAETEPYPRAVWNQLLDLGAKGISQLLEHQVKAVAEAMKARKRFLG